MKRKYNMNFDKNTEDKFEDNKTKEQMSREWELAVLDRALRNVKIKQALLLITMAILLLSIVAGMFYSVTLMAQERAEGKSKSSVEYIAKTSATTVDNKEQVDEDNKSNMKDMLYIAISDDIADIEFKRTTDSIEILFKDLDLTSADIKVNNSTNSIEISFNNTERK